MIAVDTSALMAIILNEAEADACIGVLMREQEAAISAGTVAEALIVAERRDVGAEMTRLLDQFGFEVVAVTAATARRIATAYGRWGKGAAPAALNLGDCFAYALALERSCPLLFVGEDFRRTDVASAL